MHHVIAIGASAGGLDALRRFFQSARKGDGVAYIVAQHLSPHHKSLMPELLARHTDVEMHAATEGVILAPGNAYLLPPGQDIRIENGRIRLTPRARDGSLHLPIDTLFTSLAEDRGAKAAAVVLSGLGSDGTAGLRAIKAVGGVVAAQDPGSAQFGGMPGNAIATGLVDIVARPEDIVQAIVRTLEHRPQLPVVTTPGLAPTDEDAFDRILWGVAQHSSLDFSPYKRSTLLRRIERRMRLRQADDLSSYADLLVDDATEARQLQREFLINVTRFFRDAEVFEVLREEVIPELVRKARAGDRLLRMWSAGCSTGEEPYSLALLVREALDANPAGGPVEVKIFATDVDQEALDVAMRGTYSSTVVSEVPAELVDRYLVRKNETFTVHRTIRDMVVFARHDALVDPPLTRMDAVCCRNLLIYLEVPAQQHLLRRISFALHPGGTLVLGSSETVGELVDRFEVVERRLRLYTSRGRATPAGPPISRLNVRRMPAPRRQERHWSDPTVARARVELERRYFPPALLLDDQNQLMHVFSSGAGLFQLGPGPASLDLTHILPSPATSTMTAALHRAMDQGVEVVVPSVRVRPGVDVDVADVRVIPLEEGGRRRAVLVFEPSPVVLPVRTNEDLSDHDGLSQERIRFLEDSLDQTQERLQATIEELESSNEELQATNEELLSANEELQSTNEELQSVNEELHTVNTEYQSKIRELSEANDDLDNLFQSTDVGTLFLDRHLRVRRFTAAAAGWLPLLPRDVDRPIAHFARSLPGIDLEALARRALEQGETLEREIGQGPTRRGLLRGSPFLDSEGSVGGVVLSFVDVTRLRDLQDSRADVIDGLPEHIAVLDHSGSIRFVNESWRRFATANGGSDADVEAVGQNYLEACERSYSLGDSSAKTAADGLRKVLEGDLNTFAFEYPCHSPTEERWYVMRVARLKRAESGVVVSHQDVTRRHQAERDHGERP